MKPLQILLPMGGLGQRFRDAGYNTPKPLIEVDGAAMFQKALAPYEKYSGEKNYIFIIREDADNEYQLGDQIRELLPTAKISILKHNTRGAVETCLIAENLINPELPLVIMDCDITFSSSEYFEMIDQAVTSDKYDGLLFSFDSSDPRYSFAEINRDGLVVRTAEKVAISRNALGGAYFFNYAKTFLEAAHQLMRQPLNMQMKEYYVSILYNLLIDSGYKIGLAKGAFTSFGTPEELNRYLEKNA